MNENQLRDQLGSEALAVAEILRRGVVIGDDVMPQSHGCAMCIWHLSTLDGQSLDGGSANGLLGYLEDGRYGDPVGMVLHPVSG